MSGSNSLFHHVKHFNFSRSLWIFGRLQTIFVPGICVCVILTKYFCYFFLDKQLFVISVDKQRVYRNFNGIFRHMLEANSKISFIPLKFHQSQYDSYKSGQFYAQIRSLKRFSQKKTKFIRIFEVVVFLLRRLDFDWHGGAHICRMCFG